MGRGQDKGKAFLIREPVKAQRLGMNIACF